MPPQIQTPLELGTRFLETLWFSLASRTVEAAINLYKVSDEKAEELREKFLKRGDFVIVPA
jgi:hypothetical protein